MKGFVHKVFEIIWAKPRTAGPICLAALMVVCIGFESCSTEQQQNSPDEVSASNAKIGHFAQGPPMLRSPWWGQVDRNCASPTLLQNGKVLFFDATFTGRSGTELYDPATNSFSVGPPTIHSMVCPVTAVLRSGKVLVAGGAQKATLLNFPKQTFSELYDPGTNSFSDGPMTIARPFKAIPLINGKVLLLDYTEQSFLESDCKAPGQPLKTTELYDPTVNTFTQGPTINGLFFPNWATLSDGGILLIAYNAIVLYDPRTNSFPWELGLRGWSGFLTPLPTGKVLVSGFFTEPHTLLFDPKSRTLTDGPDMKSVHQFQLGATATQLANGKVLFAAGGPEIFTHRGADLFDPATQSFSEDGKVTLAHRGNTSVSILLPNGSVLITDMSGETELYTPAK